MIAAVAAGVGKRKLARKKRQIGAVGGVLALFLAVVATAVVGVSVYEATEDPLVQPVLSGPGLWGADPIDAARANYTAQALAAGCPQIVAHHDQWVVGVAIAGAESGYVPSKLNDNPATGDLSFSLWQINMIGALGPPRLIQYGISSYDQLYDPVTNAHAACVTSGGGENWAPWSTYGSGAYRAHLAEAEIAVREVETGRGPAPPGVAGDLATGAEPAGPPGALVPVAPCTASDCRLDASWAAHALGAIGACRARGFDLVIVSANRTYELQAQLYARYLAGGGLAARPGTSNHEGGQAVDLGWAGGGGIGPGDGGWECMKAVGPRFGVYQSPSITSADSVHFSATGN